MNYRFDCSQCPTRCDGISKGTYIFEDDVAYSERKEQAIIKQINFVDGYHAEKCELDGYPDIEVYHEQTDTTFYIEIKAQRRTFMSVQRILPEADLIPSETVALNLSDLLRYFEIAEQTNRKVFILWCLENRPCIVPDGHTNYYYNDALVLRDIYDYYGDRRRFRRESGKGDVVNGVHKGVVVNYHYSLNELKEVHLLQLLEEGIL